MKYFAAISSRVPIELLILVLGLLAGCVAGPKGINGLEASLSTHSSGASAGANTNPSEDSDRVLAAVNDYLTRTGDYRPAPGGPSPSGAAPVEGDGSSPLPLPREEGRQPTPVAMSSSLVEDTTVTNSQIAVSPEPAVVRIPAAIPVVQSVLIRVPPQATGAGREITAVSTTNQPLDAERPSEDLTVDALFLQLKTRVERAEDLEAEFQLRMLRLATQQDAEARAHSTHLSETSRRFFAALVEVLAASRNKLRSTLPPDMETLAALDGLRDQLMERSGPSITTVALCRRVVTFGVYEEMPAEEFVAGRALQTIVYSEVRNLQSSITEDGSRKVTLGTRLEVLTAQGDSVWRREEPVITDLCRQRRTDFFLAQRVSLPATLKAGEYVLKMSVEDKLANLTTETLHSFSIQDGSVASSR